MHLTDPAQLGSLIRARRRDLKLSQARLAAQVGITRQWVLAMEKGNDGISIGIVMRTFAALGLLFGVGHQALEDVHPETEAHTESNSHPKARAQPVERPHPLPSVINEAIERLIEASRSGTSALVSSPREPIPLASVPEETEVT